MCHKMLPSDNPQNRTNVNGDPENVSVGRIYTVCAINMVTMVMIILLSIGNDGDAVIDIAGMRNNTVMKTRC